MREYSIFISVVLASFLGLQGCGGGGSTSGGDENETIITSKGCPLTYDTSSNLVPSNINNTYILNFQDIAEDGNYTDNFVCAYYDDGILEAEHPRNVDNKINGTARGYYESGKIRYISPIIDNLRNGTFISYYESGALNQTKPYVDDKVDGIHKIYLEIGTLSSEIAYIADKKYGMEKTYDDQGTLSGCTNYLDDTVTGSCLGHLGCPLSYDATLDRNTSDTFYDYSFDFKDIDIDGNYIDNFFCSYFASGVIMWESPQDANSIQNGIWREYYESGLIKYERPYVDGIENGIVKGYYNVGTLNWEVPYTDGKKDGDFKSYNESGAMIACAIYEDDVNIGSCMP